jgi:hypothetical protein
MRNVEIAKRGNFLDLPPVGAYVAEIKAVRVVKADAAKGQKNDSLEMMIDITEGEFKNRFMDVYEDQKERFGDTVKYKGIFRLYLPGDEVVDWIDRKFSNNIWCVQESNGGYSWDGDVTKLKDKKVGISIRKRLYTWNGEDRETTEIGQLETIADVKDGKCRPMRERDTRQKQDESSTDGSNFTEVSNSVDVPW